MNKLFIRMCLLLLLMGCGGKSSNSALEESSLNGNQRPMTENEEKSLRGISNIIIFGGTDG